MFRYIDPNFGILKRSPCGDENAGEASLFCKHYKLYNGGKWRSAQLISIVHNIFCTNECAPDRLPSRAAALQCKQCCHISVYDLHSPFLPNERKPIDCFGNPPHLAPIKTCSCPCHTHALFFINTQRPTNARKLVWSCMCFFVPSATALVRHSFLSNASTSHLQIAVMLHVFEWHDAAISIQSPTRSSSP